MLEPGECGEEGGRADRAVEPTDSVKQCRWPRRAAPQRDEDPQRRLGEPPHHRISALDVSVQAQILNLLKQLQRDLGLSYLFITHNLAVVEYLAHEVAVMYLGRIVEQGAVDEVLRNPQHPYTQALLSAVPEVDGVREVIRLGGEPPSPSNPPAGCHFHPRCAYARDVCRVDYPPAYPASPTHTARCVRLAP